MARQERVAENKPCPRFYCNNKIKAGTEAKYNAKSPIDEMQVCPACHFNECVDLFLGNGE